MKTIVIESSGSILLPAVK